MFLFLMVSLLASVAGAICGIGGGVVIKPTLDLFHVASVSTISFLSGCTVLAMSCYSVGKGLLAHDSMVDLKLGTPLAVGAALGGMAGQQFFGYIKGLFANANAVGAVQAVCLLAVTLGTLIYTIKKSVMKTRHVRSPLACVLIGLALGMMSSFLGIGGGPINLVVLGFFFSMPSKTAAQNSLYIILFSQAANLVTTIVTGSVPAFEGQTLVLMVVGGILGGVLGRAFNKRMDNQAVDKLFIGLMGLIMVICLWNAYQYAFLK